MERRFASMQTAVWFYDPGPDGTVIYDADGSVQERLQPGEDHGEASLVINWDALESLVAAASDHLPPSSAAERHLTDMIGVRDRLLALVEQQAVGQQ